jgi:hypothetical protein
MTNNADYELWAAMQADDEEPLAAPVPTPTAPVVIPEPEPAVIDIPETYVVPQPEIVEEEVDIAIEEDPYEFSDLAHSVIDETEEFPNQLFKEPQTNQITMPVIPDALNTEIVTESGEILKTGAIDIPLGTNTGSIEIITGTLETVDEEAIALDMGSETTGGIPPIRAKAVMNSSAKVGVLPIKNRRSEGQVIILATTSLLLITLGALVIAAYWFKLIN